MTTTTTNAFTITVTAFVTSPSGTTIPAATQIVDTPGNVWTVVSGEIFVNGVPQTATHGVLQLLFYGGSVWQQTSLGWWQALSLANNLATWSGVQTADPRTPALVTVPAGVHLDNWLGGSNATPTHWANLKSGLGLTPRYVAALLINSITGAKAPPSDWIYNDSGNWVNAGLPTDGSVVPLLQAFFTNGETSDSDYADIAAGTYDADLTAALSTWKTLIPNLTELAIRFQQEFNTNTFTWQVPSASQIPNWIAAWKHWCNVIHTWGNANGVKAQVVWCPDTPYQTMETYTFSQPVINFFPAPDANAVGGLYIDIIGPDCYMKGYGVSGVAGLSAGYTTPLASNTDWSLGTYVAMCQAYGAAFALCETGDGVPCDNNQSATDGVMAAVIQYLNTLSGLSPPVPIAFIALYDITSGVADQCSGGAFPAMMAGWKGMMGAGGTLLTLPST